MGVGTFDNTKHNVWPNRIHVRDTRLYDDRGGSGQRIYTTAGQGYEKKWYALEVKPIREVSSTVRASGCGPDDDSSILSPPSNDDHHDCEDYRITYPDEVCQRCMDNTLALAIVNKDAAENRERLIRWEYDRLRERLRNLI